MIKVTHKDINTSSSKNADSMVQHINLTDAQHMEEITQDEGFERVIRNNGRAAPKGIGREEHRTVHDVLW